MTSRMRFVLERSALLAVGLLISGCAGLHSSESALNPTGPQAGRLLNVYLLSLGVSVVVWIGVLLFLAGALLRKRSDKPTIDTPPELKPDHAAERRMGVTVSVLVGITAIILTVLMITEFVAAKNMHQFSETNDYLNIKITARQWWWRAEYLDPIASNTITTANEIHIPVGQKICFELNSADVIHSFWVPNLHGKKDAVPGHPTTLWLQADQPGTYWGECAEYCGFEHAQMRLVIKAEPKEQYDAWCAAQRQAAPEPTTPSQIRGKEVFLSSTCVMCHTMGGTMAFGRIGPNLSHVGSRSIIAAGALEHTRENMLKWISHPQQVKPGSNMPEVYLSEEDRAALVDYLESRQ